MTDTDIDNYTVDNILAIFNISDPTPFNVQDVANTLIAKMTTEGKTDLVTFFTEARDKVLDYLTALAAENLEVTNESHESLNKVWTDAALKSKPDDPLVNANRYFGGSSRLPAEEIANPLGNAIKGPPIIAKHIINIDSQYRTTILRTTCTELLFLLLRSHHCILYIPMLLSFNYFWRSKWQQQKNGCRTRDVYV